MGKVLGGGLPAAAYGGSRELMERIAPAGDVYQAGTLSGNPLAVAAGLATLRELDAPPTTGSTRSQSVSPPACASAAGDRAVQVSSVPGLADGLLQRRSGEGLRRRPGLRHARPTGASAVPCSIAASIRPPPSSRRGSPPWPTTTRRSRRRSPPQARPSSWPSTERRSNLDFGMTSTAISLTALAALLRDGESVISPYVRDSDEEAGARCAGRLRAARRRGAGGVRPPGRGDPGGLPAPLRDPAADRRRRRRTSAARGRLPLRAGPGASGRRGATSTRYASSPT